MTRRSGVRERWFVVCALVLLGYAGFAIHHRVSGQTSVQLPYFVMKSGGTVIGPVITVDSGGDILVALEDPDFGNSLPLLFRSFGLQGTEPRVQYDGLNCMGNPYIIQPSTHSGSFVRLLGYSYGVGMGSGGDLWVFRGADVAIPQPTIQSMWINGACNNTGGFGTLTNAVEIINITNDFPGPYTLE